jgi:hypothetical protein
MTTTETPEYRKLALDSSNEMMDHDGDRGLGRYPQAALHIREAGFGRLRMGQIMSDSGDFVHAAEDWLSAAACFYLVPDLERMRDAFERVRRIDQAGHIPAERRDIHAAIKEREEQLRTLDEKLNQFRQEYGRMVGPTQTANPKTLEWLLRQVRELPGSPLLHANISNQALQLGLQPLAIESLDWALRFDPVSPHLAALRVSQLFAFGEPVRAAQIGRELLKSHPEMAALRITVAQALAFRAKDQVADVQVADWEAAIEVLQPIVGSGSANALERLMAISLAAILRHGLGHDTEYRRLLSSFDQMAEVVRSPAEQSIVARLRRDLPQVFPAPGPNGAAPSTVGRRHPPTEPDYATLCQVIGQLSPLTAGAPV